MESIRKHTKELLLSNGLRPRKRFGQNFLVNARTLDAIVESAELSPEDTVLEIGAGTGILTEQLALSSSKVIAVELDEGLFCILQSTFQNNPNVSLIYSDILDLDLSQILSAHKKIKIIGNLPYYITTPILMKILHDAATLPIKMILAMVQAEVGQRIAAAPGTKEYGALSVAIAYRSEAKIIHRVSATSFYPRPKVDSVVIKLNVMDSPSVDVENEQIFFGIVRAAFQYRRKTLRNAINLGCRAGSIQLEAGSVERAMKTLNFDANRRGETLSISEFAGLSNIIQEQQ